MAGPVTVKGLRELQAAFAHADKETNRLLRAGLREVAEPVRAEAEQLAVERIPRVGPRWSRMRTGVTRKVVYVAPRERGLRTRGDDPRRRPRFGTLLMDRAMEPALERHAPEIEAAVEHLLDEVSADFNHGGL
jgi:hypothetical protein